MLLRGRQDPRATRVSAPPSRCKVPSGTWRAVSNPREPAQLLGSGAAPMHVIHLFETLQTQPSAAAHPLSICRTTKGKIRRSTDILTTTNSSPFTATGATPETNSRRPHGKSRTWQFPTRSLRQSTPLPPPPIRLAPPPCCCQIFETADRKTGV